LARPCWRGHINEVILARSCWRVMLTRSCWRGHVGKVMLARSCWQGHACWRHVGKAMLTRSYWQGHVGKVMLARSLAPGHALRTFLLPELRSFPMHTSHPPQHHTRTHTHSRTHHGPVVWPGLATLTKGGKNNGPNPSMGSISFCSSDSACECLWVSEL
jgi:hypothetical protein